MEVDMIVRLFAMILIFLAFYYIKASQCEKMQEFNHWTTYIYCSVPFIVVISIIINSVLSILLILITIDLTGTVWTSWGLDKDNIDFKTMINYVSKV